MTSRQHILDSARDFRTGSAILASQFGQPVFPLRTTIIAAAFSIELYIKFLIAVNNITITKRHNLAVLYGLLPVSVQQRVAIEYRGSVPVDQALATYKNVFIDWRYVYETQHQAFTLNWRDLQHLVDALEVVAAAEDQLARAPDALD